MIHYFIGGNLGYDFRDTWVKYAGNMEHIKWTPDTVPVDQYPELDKYMKAGQWSIVSDFVRRWAIYKYGGIYLDFDVELIRPIDHLLDEYSFICIEGPPAYANAAVTGGKAGNRHHGAMLEQYLGKLRSEGGFVKPNLVGLWIATDYLRSIGGEPNMDEVTVVDEFKTFPKEYFYPFNYNESYTSDCITENTLGIHWWKKGWS